MKTPLTLLFLLLGFGALAQWSEKSGLPASGRNHPVTFSINGTGYVTTGGSQGPPFYYDDMWKYDPVNDSWWPLQDFPGGNRSFAYGVAVGGFGYVGFGANNSTFFDDWYRFDPVSETWNTLASCPCTPRTHPAMVATTSKIYVGLGGSVNGDLKDWWEYDIQTDSWTQKTDFPSTRRHHPFYFNIGDDVYVGMGHHQADIFNDLYHYDIDSDTWTQMASLPGEGRVAGTQFTYNGRGYVLSGEGEDHQNMDTGEFWQYDPVANSWGEFEPHPGIARWAPGSFVIGDSVFMFGGQTEDIQPDERDLWMFNFAGAASLTEISPEAINIYPNPAKEVIHIDSDLELEVITISNIVGEIVFEATANLKSVAVSELPAGVYVLTAVSNKHSVTKRFTKK